MENLKIHFANEDRWSSCESAHAKGYAFLHNEMFPTDKLSELLVRQKGLQDFESLLRQLNGFFAVVLTIGDSVLLAVDHVRSLPLFYGIFGKKILISDDARWIREQIFPEEIDVRSVTEYLLTRSVWGRDTLLKSVKQVPAGELVTLTITSEGVRPEYSRYYEFGYTKPADDSFQQLVSRSDASLMHSFRRLIEFAAGRTIVVPLGGGLDSRIIMLMLKRMGYDKVVAFTYGRPGYREAVISRKVAEELGFRWEFVAYSNDAWRSWYNTPEWGAYSTFADGLCSTPHLQDWPAVWELRNKKLIPEDSIFVPGHMPAPPDSVRKLPVEWLKEASVTSDELAGEICDGYCTLYDWSSHRETFRPELCKKIKQVLQLPANVDPKQAIGYFDRWWWETSWSKFMVNSVRAYEFWGYDWWLPLWDLEFVSFWRALPLSLRLGKRFELPYVRTLETDTTGKPPIQNTSNPTVGPALVRIVDRLHLRGPASRMRARLEYGRHHFAWYGLIPEHDYNRAFHGKENINTYIANQTLKRILPTYQLPEGLDFLADPDAGTLNKRMGD